MIKGNGIFPSSSQLICNLLLINLVFVGKFFKGFILQPIYHLKLLLLRSNSSSCVSRIWTKFQLLETEPPEMAKVKLGREKAFFSSSELV